MARSIIAIAIAAIVAATAYFFNYEHPYHNWIPFIQSPDGITTLQHDQSYQLSIIDSTLSPLLSSRAQVHLPGSHGFNASTERWNSHIAPTFAVVVEVATEADVQTTIQWANSATLPFLAISGGHGVVQSLNHFSHGVGIWMRGMRDVKVLDGGESARIEGGALSGEMVHKLWDEGKMTGE